MKGTFLTIVIYLFSTVLYAQSTFVGHIGGYDSEVPYGMITDHAKNIIICGVFDDSVDFDMSASVFQLTNINFYDGFIAKYDSIGTFLWAKQFGTYINAIEVDEFDNLYAVGILEGTKDVDPSTATFNLSSNGLQDGVLIKLDPLGNFISAINIGSAGDDGITSIKINDSGAFYISGGFSDTADFDPSGAVFSMTPSNMGTFYFCNTGFIAKYDYNFNFIWAKRIAGGGLITLHKGNPSNEYFLLSTTGNSATSTDSADFDPSTFNFVNPVPDSLPDGHWMGHIKYSDNGEYIWSKFYRTFGSLGSTSLGFYDVKMDADQNIYSTGLYTLPFTAYPYNDISLEPFVPLTGQPDGFLIKIDSSANLIWQKRFGSDYGADYGSSLTLDNANNIHLTGAFIDTAEFNDGGVSQTLMAYSVSSFQAYDYDAFVVGYDNNGNFLYKGQVGGNGSDAGYKITTTGNKIALIGIFADTTDCDPFAGVASFTSFGYQDMFLSFYDNNYSTTTSINILQNPQENIFVYPNPFSSNTTLEFNLAETKNISVSVIDVTGRTVMNIKTKEFQQGNNKITIDLSKFNNGIYFCKIKSNENLQTVKLIKN